MFYDTPTLSSLAISSEMDSQTNFAQDALAVAVGSVVDFGATLYNSTFGMVGLGEIDTYDAMLALGGNSFGSAYLEHKGLIETLSFVGGVFIPGMAGVKASRVLRSGLKGTSLLGNTLSHSRYTSELTNLGTLIEQGHKATREYRHARNGVMLRGLAQGAVDNAAAEVAILGAMNAHPFMEDYMENVPANFLSSLALGVGIGSFVDFASTSYQIRKVAGSAMERSIQPVTDVTLTAPGMADGVLGFQMQWQSIREYDNLINNAETSEATKQIALHFKASAQVQADNELFRAFDQSTADSFKAAGNDAVDSLRLEMGDPKLAGVGKISFFEPSAKVKAPQTKLTTRLSELLTVKIDPKTGDTIGSEINSVFVPKRGNQPSFVTSVEEAQRQALAQDGFSFTQLSAASKQVRLRDLDDVALDITHGHGWEADGLFVKYALGYAEMDISKFTQIAIRDTNLPAMQAMATKVRSIRAEINELTQNLAATATPKEAAKIQARIDKLDTALNAKVTLVADADALFGPRVLTKKVQQQSGLKPTHLSDLNNVTRQSLKMGDWPGLSPHTRNMISRWIGGGGGENYIREAIADYRRAPHKAPGWIREIMENPERQKQLAELRKHADSDGYIYMRRGMNTKPNGHNEAESYTTSPAASAVFARGTEHDYAWKIHVDDVVGYLHNKNLEGAAEAEWIVMSPTRRYARQQSQLQAQPMLVDAETHELATKLPTVALRDMESKAQELTEQTIRQLAGEERNAADIAARTNKSAEEIEAFLANHGSGLSGEYRRSAANTEAIKDSFGPTNRMLSLRDNGHIDSYKNVVNAWQRGADHELLDTANREITMQLLQTSDSAMIGEYLRELNVSLSPANQLSDFLAISRMLNAEIGKINEGFAGFRFITTADHYSRMMGDVGTLINRQGEALSRVSTQMVDRFVGAANVALSKIVDDPAKLLQHNVIVQAARSSGKRLDIQDGMLVEYHGVKAGQEVWKPVVYQDKTIHIPEELQDIFKAYQQIGQELQRVRVTKAKITGMATPADKGLWLPNFDPTKKFMAFMRKTNSDGVAHSLIVADTLEDLNAQRRVLIDRYAGDPDSKVSFLLPSEKGLADQIDYDKLKEQALRGQIQRADLTEFKAGNSAQELPSATLAEGRTLLNGYTARIYAEMQDVQGLLFSDVLHKLDEMRNYANRGLDMQGMSKFTKFLKEGVDTATIMRSTLLGRNDLLNHYTPARWANDSFSAALDVGINTVRRIGESFQVNAAAGAKHKERVTEKWAKIADAMEDAGLPYPFKELDALNVERQFAKDASAADARRLIGVSNGYAALMALRFGELAHGLVSMLSMPVLTQSAIAGSAKTFAGRQQLGKTGLFDSMRHMMNGVALTNNPNPAMLQLIQHAEHNGVFQPIVSEATDVVRMRHLQEKGAIAKAERLVEKLESTMQGWLTKPSDYSEVMSRRIAFGTGVSVAIKKYGLKLGQDNSLIYTYAREFVDRAIGNYTPHQRPVMFQGTLGAAAGLFQTYMITFAQNVYRHLELRDFKALGQVMAWQGSLFGFSGLPGYDAMSKFIGEHYTNDHTDLTTGIYEAVDDDLANVLVYGLPSNVGALWGDSQVGPNLSTRGAIDPMFGVAGANMVKESAMAGANIASAIANINETGGQGFWEALSSQSVSRPIARMSELVSGHSITSQGRTVQTPEEVYTYVGVMSRVLGTRPLQEWKLRSALHLNTHYGSIDRDNRQTAMQSIRTSIRNGALDSGTLHSAFDKYLEAGGTPDGFRSALNEAIQFESRGLDARLMQELDHDSPLLSMINTM